MKYTFDYFIKKFEAIPEENWYTNEYSNPNNSNQHCALGHCGETNNKTTMESKALYYKLKANEILQANDGRGNWKDSKLTPKERVIEYLKQLKKSSK